MTSMSQTKNLKDPMRHPVGGDDSPAGRVLLIEDDADIASLVRMHLEDARYQVTVAGDGRTGLDEAFLDRSDLLILDLSLPDLDGLDICRQLTQRDRRPLILMLTARCADPSASSS